MARRYIGDAVVYIMYHDAGDYRGSVVVRSCPCGCSKDKLMKVWKFKGLKAPAIGFGPGIAYDSPKAYDEMAESAVGFGSYYTTMNRSEEVIDGYPPGDVADAITDAAGVAYQDDGTYEVRRSR